MQVLAAALPADLPASIFVVLHTAAYSENILPHLLERAGPLPASNARDWEEIKPGHIYVAPADYHLVLEPSGYTRITRGPKENRFRPAVDPLFRSAAAAFGPRVIGIVLTGWLDDGTAGLWAIKERGGTAIVQRPEDALASSMPMNALKHVEVNHCVALKEIAPLLVRLTSAVSNEKAATPVPEAMELEVKIAKEDKALQRGITEWGDPSLYACPECHGVLLQLQEGSNLRFRCHTGHAYSLETLLSEFHEQTEATLWGALRSLEESILLMRGMASHLTKHQQDSAAALLVKKAADAQARADRVRQIVLDREQSNNESSVPGSPASN